MLGTSANDFDQYLAQILRLAQPQRILELGCGQGKFGKMLQINGVTPSKLVAVQKIFSDADIGLLQGIGYQNIVDVDILEYFRGGFDEQYDMVVALDVIEHFLYSDILSIINFALYRSDYMLLAWPSAHPQFAETSPFDRHRASFELRDLSDRFDVVLYAQTGFAQMNCVHRYHVALLRGFMNVKVLPAMGSR
jgi:SAM-dependent methyltransferase